MSISIHITPERAQAGECGRWKITFSAPEALAPGTALTLRQDYHAQLALFWQTEDPLADNYVAAGGPEGVALAIETTGASVHLTVVTGEIEPGETITFTLGGRSGFQIWPVAHDLGFSLDVEPGGETFRFQIPVDAAPACKFVVTNPSTPRAEANLLFRAVDVYGNKATAYQGTAHVTSSPGRSIPSRVEFTPRDRGARRIAARLRASGKDGAERISVLDPQTQVRGNGNPIETGAGEQLFWGDLHCHSNLGQALNWLSAPTVTWWRRFSFPAAISAN